MWLSGIRIIDFTNLLPGPYATMRLADLGCEVTKVESPDGGDPARYTGPKVAGTGVVFMANNRNKESIVVDLKSDAGHSQALSLIQAADVVIEGFRPGVMQKLGLDYATLCGIHPGIVYCSLTGYGQTGPYVELAGHDLNYMAVSGMLAQLRDAAGQPIVPGVQFADLIGGIVASEAILAALVKRDRTGQGSYIDISMTDALIGMLHNHALLQSVTGEEFGISELGGSRICYHLYQTKDGRTVSLAALEPKFWRAFCAGVGKPEWAGFGFCQAIDGNPEDYPEYEAVKTLFLSWTLAEWTAFANETDCCLQPVLNISEVMTSPHVKARGILQRIPFVEAGPCESKPGKTVSLQDAPARAEPTVFLPQIDTHAGGHLAERPVPDFMKEGVQE
jgi:alpha-methylacyl-CoA racemase